MSTRQLSISEKGLNLIKEFEGLRLTAYKALPSEKYYTIGYGHYGADVAANSTITQAEATRFLRKDVNFAENAVRKLQCYACMTQNQFDALVSFTYNCGTANLSTLTRNRPLPVIGEKIVLYNKAGGKVLNGLVRRRKAEQDLFFS